MNRPLLALAILLPGAATAASISVNMAVWPIVDNQVVDPGETALVGISGPESVDGTNWNNIDLRGAGSSGTPTVFTTATQGGNNIDLVDSSGADSGVDMTSSGLFFANFANTSTPNQGLTGDGGLMQGFLNLSNTETISLSGMASWAPNGYKVYAVFDIGPVTRTYGVSMTDGTTSQIFWTADTAGTDADANNDGVIEWLETTATTSGTAVTDANYAVYGTFTGDTLIISGSKPTAPPSSPSTALGPSTTPPAQGDFSAPSRNKDGRPKSHCLDPPLSQALARALPISSRESFGPIRAGRISLSDHKV